MFSWHFMPSSHFIVKSIQNISINVLPILIENNIQMMLCPC
jgi:hypothetical protein